MIQLIYWFLFGFGFVIVLSCVAFTAYVFLRTILDLITGSDSQ